jgi:hypothetical protein
MAITCFRWAIRPVDRETLFLDVPFTEQVSCVYMAKRPSIFESPQNFRLSFTQTSSVREVLTHFQWSKRVRPKSASPGDEQPAA